MKNYLGSFFLLLTEFVLFFMSQSGQSEQELSWYQRKADLNSEIQNLKSKMRDSQVGFVIFTFVPFGLFVTAAWVYRLLIYSIQIQKFRDELRNRSRVLKMLGHIDADGVLQLKGRAACLIDTGDELLITELMFNGINSIWLSVSKFSL